MALRLSSNPPSQAATSRPGRVAPPTDDAVLAARVAAALPPPRPWTPADPPLTDPALTDPSPADHLDGAVGRFEQSDRRLRALASAPALRGADVGTLLREHGVSRRSFLGWASATAAALMLPDAFAPRIARAAEVLNRIPVIWIEGQDCAGNTEALLRTSAPTIDELLFQTISLEYHETLMAAAGMQAQERKANAVQAFKGKYVLVIEGAVPNGLDGTYCTVGPAAKPFRDEVVELAEGAALVIAAGACAFYGGIPVAAPNPTDAVGVSSVVHGKPLVNVPACPLNPANLIGVLLHYAMTGQPPALDGLLRPKFAFGYRIHDNCERRAHFEAGEFVQDWGDEGARNNWCLYRMGCKGPMTNNNCSIIRYNDATNWPIGVGHGCIGCAEVGFWDRYAQERPLANAGIPAAGFFGLGVEKSVDRFGLGLLTAAAAGVAIHAGVSMTLRRRAAAAAAGTPAPTADATSPSEEPS